MNWFKKLIGASVLTSLFFIAPEKVQAESYLPSGLYNTGGYQLLSLAQNVGNLSYCALPSTCSPVSILPAPSPVMSIPSFVSGIGWGGGWGGNCGTFTQSCAPIYATTGFGGCGTLPVPPPITYQPLPALPPPTLTYLPVFSGGMPSIPMPYDNSYFAPSTLPISYGGCNPFVVACAQPSVNPYANLFPPSPFTGTGGVTTAPGVILPRVYQVPRGFKTH